MIDTNWDELIETFAYWTHWKPAKPQAIYEADKARAALRSAIAELEDTSKDDNDHLERIVSLAQKYQPAGSPPPGDAHILISWILRSLKDRADKAEQERDNLKTVLHCNQDADYDKQLQIETLKSQLAEAEADADRLAKELQDWIVFAEANDQIYAARSGMNAMLHHLKRKEGK